MDVGAERATRRPPIPPAYGRPDGSAVYLRSPGRLRPPKAPYTAPTARARPGRGPSRATRRRMPPPRGRAHARCPAGELCFQPRVAYLSPSCARACEDPAATPAEATASCLAGAVAAEVPRAAELALLHPFNAGQPFLSLPTTPGALPTPPPPCNFGHRRQRAGPRRPPPLHAAGSARRRVCRPAGAAQGCGWVSPWALATHPAGGGPTSPAGVPPRAGRTTLRERNKSRGDFRKIPGTRS
jgi:hypothetical protein